MKGGRADTPINFSEMGGVHCSPAAVPEQDEGIHFTVGESRVIIDEEDLAGVGKDESIPRSIALRMLPPRLADFAAIDWNWRPEGWPEDKELPVAAQEKVDEVIDAWLNLGVTDSRLIQALRKSLCLNMDEGCIIGERWWSMEDRGGMIDAISGSPPEKVALDLIFSEAIEEGGLHIRGDGTFEELEDNVLRVEETSCHANLVALWPQWGDVVLEEIYGITGEEADKILEKQAKRKQGFGAFLKKMDAERAEHVMLSRFPWNDGDMGGLCGRADELVRKARIDGAGKTITMAKKGRNPAEEALGWAWINVHERAESEGWHFDSDARDKGRAWEPALKALFEASAVLAEGGSSDDYVEAMKTFATRSGATDFVEV